MIWVWVVIELERKEILGISISKERSMPLAEQFVSRLVKIHGQHPLTLPHRHIHSSYERSIIETTIQYIKDRTECFDDYFPYRKRNCKLLHVWNWLHLFLGYHNK